MRDVLSIGEFRALSNSLGSHILEALSACYRSSDRFEPSDQLKSAPAGDETVLLDLRDGSYFGLDSVGAFVWARLVENQTFSELADGLCATFETDRGTAEVDLAHFLNELRRSDLISVACAPKIETDCRYSAD